MRHPRIRARFFVQCVVLAIAAATAANAANFDLGVTIQAGKPNGVSQWELGIGPSSSPAQVKGNLTNYYVDGLANRFEIGYTNSSNSAFLRLYSSASIFQQINYAGTGLGLGANSIWTIPANSLFVSATSRNQRTTIAISGLTLSGVDVLQPFQITTLTATQLRSNSTVPLTSPVQFRTGASGNWLLSGNIAFSGLQGAGNGGGASGNQLSMGAGIYGTSTQTPEPRGGPLVLSGIAFVAGLGWWRRSRIAH